MFDIIFIIPNVIFKLMFQGLIRKNVKVRKVYYKFAKFLATNGFNPPLTVCPWWQERAWSRQGLDNKLPSPEDYLACNDSTDRLFEDVLPLLSKDANILEIGCNAGRHLNHIYNMGYKNLTGIDISSKSIDAMSTYFPEMAKNITKIAGNAAEIVRKMDSKAYDLVFCHGVLVNVSSSRNYIFKEICRICKGYIVTLESEHSFTSYPRDFQKMFERHNFYMGSSKFMVREGEDDNLVMPKKVTDKNLFKRNATIRVFIEKV